MKLVVGLGNPGKQYILTRHNIGFIIIDMICEHLNLSISKTKFNGQYIKTTINNNDVIFLKPLTFMNLSGNCVSNFMQYFNIAVKDVLIIHDDVDLSFGQWQYKQNFSVAGHNGIKDIFIKTATKEFQRLRIGVGKNINFSTAVWVLSNFTSDELTIIANNKSLFIESVISWINNNKFENIMSQYNKR